MADPAAGAQEINGRPAMDALRPYLKLTKPMLNLLTVLTSGVGFILASAGPLDWLLLGWTVLGTMHAALGAAALNQWLERRTDALMKRTSRRPLPQGKISPIKALVVGLGMVLAGLWMLAIYVNMLAFWLCFATLLIYLGIYTPLKKTTTLCTIVGAVSGAIPPLIGYAGAAGHLDYAAWTLAVLLFVWQIPHFLALAERYKADYKRGGLQMLPSLDRDGAINSNMLLLYSVALLPLGLAPALAGLGGAAYVGFSLTLGLGLVSLAVNQHRRRTVTSARLVFLASIVYLPVLLIVLLVDHNSATAGSVEAGVQAAAASSRTQLNRFSLDQALIPAGEIYIGAGRDSIPALTDPAFMAADEVEVLNRGGHGSGKFIVNGERVIGVEIKGEARAYPLRILNWHEIINDTLGGEPVAITYCPLCDSAVTFRRKVGGETREFGVSGLLYNSNLLLYDRGVTGADSLWSQLQLRAISGPAARDGLALEPVFSELTYWGDWRSRYPNTTVITGDTAISKRYKRSPYGHYYETGKLMFPVSPAPPADGLPLMTRIVAIESEGGWRTYAYDLPDMSYRGGSRMLDDTEAGIRLELLERPYGIQSNVLRVTSLAEGRRVPAVYTFWFAWYSLHPGAAMPDLRLLGGQWP